MYYYHVSWGVEGVQDVYVYTPDMGAWYGDYACTQRIERLDVPRRPGYRFEGCYYYKGQCGVNADGSLNIAALMYTGKSCTVSARWTLVFSRVELNFNNGSGVADELWRKVGDNLNFYNADGCVSAVTSVGIPFWIGHRFIGYFSEADGGTKYVDADGIILVAPSRVNQNVMYAHWEASGTENAIADYFNLSSPALVPVASTTGDIYHRVAVQHGGRYESGVNEVGGIWRNPSVTYVVKADTTVSVKLGKGFAAQKSGSTMTVSGFMITTVEIVTEVGKFPTVTVSAVANEGAAAINKFNVSVPVVARSKAQNLLNAISGGGFLQRVALVAACDPVVCEENLMPCASDIVNGRYELSAETLAANGEAAPTMATASGTNGGFALLDVPRQERDCDFLRYSIEARKEMD